MSVTPLGSVLLPLGLVLFVLRRRALFWASVASIPFFETAVIVLGHTVVRPFQYFGGMFLLSQLVDLLGRPRGMRGEGGPPPATYAALVFLAVCAVSLVMPVLLEGRVHVVPVEVPFLEYHLAEPLEPTTKNLTQLAYPVFAVLLFLSLRRDIRTRDDLKAAIRVSVYLSVAVVLSGLACQFAMLRGRTGLVSRVVRIVRGAGDFDMTVVSAADPALIDIGLPRIYSLAGEPSFTGFYLAFAGGLAGGLLVAGRRLRWRPRLCGLIFAAALVAMLLSGATTGVLAAGLVMCSMAFVPLLGSGGRGTRSRLRVLGYAVGTLVLLGVVFAAAAPLLTGMRAETYLADAHVAKLLGEQGSGMTRWRTVEYSLGVFAQSPILGVGFGSHRSASLFTSLLSNVGILGTCAFLAVNAAAVGGALRAYRGPDRDLADIAFVLLTSFFAVLPLMFLALAMSALAFGWYWLLIAMMTALPRLAPPHDRLDIPHPAG